jgi:hypothetical protein
LTGEVIRSSKVPAGSPAAGAGRPTGARWAPQGRRSWPGSASTTSAPWSTTTAVWPIRRTCPTSRAPRTPRLSTAAAWFVDHGIARIERVMPDNHWSYRRARSAADVLQRLDARHVFIKPHSLWQNGEVLCFNRTLQAEWAYRQLFTSNDDRLDALAPWLKRYNFKRPHSSLGGRLPISRVSPTSLRSTASGWPTTIDGNSRMSHSPCLGSEFSHRRAVTPNRWSVLLWSN